jgi:hypothetical protein
MWPWVFPQFDYPFGATAVPTRRLVDSRCLLTFSLRSLGSLRGSRCGWWVADYKGNVAVFPAEEDWMLHPLNGTKLGLNTFCIGFVLALPFIEITKIGIWKWAQFSGLQDNRNRWDTSLLTSMGRKGGPPKPITAGKATPCSRSCAYCP